MPELFAGGCPEDLDLLWPILCLLAACIRASVLRDLLPLKNLCWVAFDVEVLLEMEGFASSDPLCFCFPPDVACFSFQISSSNPSNCWQISSGTDSRLLVSLVLEGATFGDGELCWTCGKSGENVGELTSGQSDKGAIRGTTTCEDVGVPEEDLDTLVSLGSTTLDGSTRECNPDWAAGSGGE